MEKKNKRGKAVALSLAMAAALSLPLGASAQQALFGGGGGGVGGSLLDRNGGGTDITMSSSLEHQTFGVGNYEGTFGHQTFGVGNYEVDPFTHETFTSPTGSGLLVLLAAGMGYAAAKKRKGGKGQRNKSK